MNPPMSHGLNNLELGDWTVEADPSINPQTADGRCLMKTSEGIVLYCVTNPGSKPYGGWLAKNVASLANLVTLPCSITFQYNLKIDPAALHAQVIETDSRLTDKAGNTFPGDFQIVIAKNWQVQLGDSSGAWHPTNVNIAPLTPNIFYCLQITYALNYTALTIEALSLCVNGVLHPLNESPTRAAKLGWAPSEIVTQFQPCTGANGGGYSLTFSGIGYQMR
jgi:hypothetical protein